jgi:hypothetical protein
MKEAICALNGYVNLYCKCLHRTSLDEVKRKKMKSRIVSVLPLNVISKKECEKTAGRIEICKGKPEIRVNAAEQLHVE